MNLAITTELALCTNFKYWLLVLHKTLVYMIDEYLDMRKHTTKIAHEVQANWVFFVCLITMYTRAHILYQIIVPLTKVRCIDKVFIDLRGCTASMCITKVFFFNFYSLPLREQFVRM